MKEQQRGILRLATLVALPILLGGASCNNDSDDSDVVRAAASCATSPSGGTIHIAQGDPFRIILAGSVPCTGGGGVVVICGSASFRATVNQSRFFSAGTLNEWSVGPSLGVQRDLALSTSTWLGSDDVLIEVTPNQTGSDVLARCDFDLTVRLPAPELSSPEVARGGSTCSTSFTTQWTRQSDDSTLAGYGFSLMHQDDPNYHALRFPGNTIQLGPDVTTFTTPPLEAGRTWEFNLLPIDTLGGSARFYSSFWASIEDCTVTVKWPR